MFGRAPLFVKLAPILTTSRHGRRSLEQLQDCFQLNLCSAEVAHIASARLCLLQFDDAFFTSANLAYFFEVCEFESSNLYIVLLVCGKGLHHFEKKKNR